MKKPIRTKIITEEPFEFSRAEVSFVNRLQGLSIKYKKVETNKDGKERSVSERVSVLGYVVGEDNPHISGLQLSLIFQVENQKYDCIEDLSITPGVPKDYGTIKQQAIALMRRELPEYVSRVLPEK